MKKQVVSLMLVAGLVISASAKKNLYTKEGTDEYVSVTAKITGKWKIESADPILPEGQIGKKFTSGVINFKTLPKKNRLGEYTISLELTKDLANKRRERFGDDEDRKELTIDSYKLVAEGRWGITAKGKFFLREAENTVPYIEGKGKMLDSFRTKETSIIASASSAESSGGIGNFIAAAVVKSSTGTEDIVPEFNSFSGDIKVKGGKITITDDDLSVILQKVK